MATDATAIVHHHSQPLHHHQTPPLFFNLFSESGTVLHCFTLFGTIRHFGTISKLFWYCSSLLDTIHYCLVLFRHCLILFGTVSTLFGTVGHCFAHLPMFCYVFYGLQSASRPLFGFLVCFGEPYRLRCLIVAHCPISMV